MSWEVPGDDARGSSVGGNRIEETEVTPRFKERKLGGKGGKRLNEERTQPVTGVNPSNEGVTA
jgi:hypothetical protein